MKDVVLVMGASVNTERYSNKAIKLLRKNQKNVSGLCLRRNASR